MPESPVPSIPILRSGRVYRSLDEAELWSVDGRRAEARVSMANSGLVRRDLLDLNRSRDVLREIPARDLAAMCRRAGEIFLRDELPVGVEEFPQNPDDYVRALSATSGLPFTLIRRNMARLHEVFTQIEVILAGLTRGLDLEVIDRGYGEQQGVPVSYAATTNVLSVILPSNSPAVNALWIPSLVLKTPVLLKPGREEPWTPWRMAQAFLRAGYPREAFHFYPTGHEGGTAIIRRSGRVMMFGDDATVSQYAQDERIEVHGSGRSKILIGEDAVEDWPELIEILVESVSANSGRSCINASAIVTPRHGKAIAEALAQALAGWAPKAADDPSAVLSGFANPQFAEHIDGAIEEGLATPGAVDVSAALRAGPRHVVRDNMHYLLPTIVHCESFNHPLANREFLFPYASVVEMPQADMLEAIGPSLVVTAATGDERWIRQLLESSWIDRLNIGKTPTNRVQWNQPHEGNLFEFLYKRRSFQLTPMHV
ncbi:MAG TPA: aldehyde dehydrogenase family protein [Verrucomicrobiales bacterium]|nr:aldehyde dehydrogenase family protein [Verrucomicrobiales bacterium]